MTLSLTLLVLECRGCLCLFRSCSRHHHSSLRRRALSAALSELRVVKWRPDPNLA